MRELEALNASLRCESCPAVVVCGDFNYDANDQTSEEAHWSPERVIGGMIDVWDILHPGELGATEDEVQNTFRAALKVKPAAERRRSRYDRILARGLEASKAALIGDQPIPGLAEIHGKTPGGRRTRRHAELFPSDHFGLSARLYFP